MRLQAVNPTQEGHYHRRQSEQEIARSVMQ